MDENYLKTKYSPVGIYLKFYAVIYLSLYYSEQL